MLEAGEKLDIQYEKLDFLDAVPRHVHMRANREQKAGMKYENKYWFAMVLLFPKPKGTDLQNRALSIP